MKVTLAPCTLQLIRITNVCHAWPIGSCLKSVLSVFAVLVISAGFPKEVSHKFLSASFLWVLSGRDNMNSKVPKRATLSCSLSVLPTGQTVDTLINL